MGVVGDFHKLRALRQKLERVASPQFLEKVAVELEDPLNELIANGFKQQRDPWGNKWPGLKAERTRNRRARRRGKRGGQKILNHTGGLLGSRFAKATGTTIAAGLDKDYAVHHQHGTRHMVARKMIPDDRLPPAWEERLNGEVEDAIKRELKG